MKQNTNTKSTLIINTQAMFGRLDAIRETLPLAARSVSVNLDKAEMTVTMGKTDYNFPVSVFAENPPKHYVFRNLSGDVLKIDNMSEHAAEIRETIFADARNVALRALIDGRISRAAARMAAKSRTENPNPEADAEDALTIVGAVASVICYADTFELYSAPKAGNGGEYAARILPALAVWYADASANAAELAKIAAEGDFNLAKLVEMLRDSNIGQKDKIRAVQNVYGHFVSAWNTENAEAGFLPPKLSANASDVTVLTEIFGRKYRRKDGVPELLPASEKFLVSQFYLHLIRVLNDAKVDVKRWKKATEQPTTVEEPAA